MRPQGSASSRTGIRQDANVVYAAPARSSNHATKAVPVECDLILEILDHRSGPASELFRRDHILYLRLIRVTECFRYK